jgi:peptidoglycan/xylan/chitin deacetylase (PgdA/CDA1 family)
LKRLFFPAAAILAGITVIIAVLLFEKTAFPKPGDDGVLILLYHTFTEGEVTEPSLYTTAEKFEQDLQTLLDLGFVSLSLYDYADGSFDPDGRYFAVTFDDGYLTNYETAFPILQKLNCYADIFKNTDNEYMDHHFSYGQAREMEAGGLIAVHSHFPVHEPAASYEPEEFARLLERSFDTLERELGPRRHRLFAYVGGDYNRATYNAAEAAGVKLQFVQTQKFNAQGLALRVNISYDTDMAALAATVR